jgi:hypothetical protein
MGRYRIVTSLTLVLFAAVPATGACAADLSSWNRGDQKAVVRAGVMANLPGGFEGQRPLAPADMQTALAAVAAKQGVQPVSAPSGTPSVASFDRVLVDQLGLTDLAVSVQDEARRAGIAPPSRFGTEVVARQLGLRFNHPAPDDAPKSATAAAKLSAVPKPHVALVLSGIAPFLASLPAPHATSSGEPNFRH